MLRPLLATVSTFQWMDRPRTGFSARWEDFGVSLGGVAEQLTFFEIENKTNTAGAIAARSVMIPVPAGDSLQRRLGTLLLHFKDLKTRVCPGLARDGAAFWAVHGDSPARAWTSAVQNTWLQEALAYVDASPPENFVWSAYSLRHGAASAAPGRKFCHGQAHLCLGSWA